MRIQEDFIELSRAIKEASDYFKQGVPYLAAEQLIKEYNISAVSIEHVMHSTYGQLAIR